jgi:LuxR family maltose regulon positive regulatory protein
MSEFSTPTSLLRTKLYRPPVTEDYVQRPQLHSRLDRIFRRPLTLVSAPAGYGKTTLASAWLQSEARPGAWLSLDDGDNDLGVFLAYFLAAVRGIVLDFGRQTQEYVSATTLPPSRVIVDSLANELDRVEQEFAIVLDDYHAITNPHIHDLITQLLRHPPRAMHLVLVTRHDPPLPLSELRARNQVVEFRVRELRFSLPETTSFMRRAVDSPLGAETISVLEEKTEGWPAGLRLAALSFSRRDDLHQHIAGLNGNNLFVMEYLVEQVLRNLPPETQAFLIQTSILERLCGPLCRATLKPDVPGWNGRAILQGLEEANLFTIPLDDRRHWYRYHHLFRQILQRRLADTYSHEAVAALHTRAGVWLAGNGLVEEALEHLLAAGDVRAAVQLVAHHRHELMNQEQWQRLSRWLRLFPEPVIDESPDLLLLRTWFAFMQRFDLAGMDHLLNRVEAIFERNPLELDERPYLQGEIDTLRSMILYQNVDGEGAIDRGRQALAILPQEWYVMRSYAWLYLAGGQQMIGDLGGAFESIQRGRREDLVDGRPAGVRIHGSAAFLQWMAADLSNLKETADYMLAIASTGNQQQSLGWAHAFLANVHYQRNNLTAAQHHIQRVFDQRYVNYALVNLYSALLLALIAQAQGKAGKAREFVALGFDYLADMGSIPLLPVAQGFQAELALMQGRTSEAEQWAAQFGATLPLRAMPLFYVPQITLPKVFLAQKTPAGLRAAAEVLSKLHSFALSIHNIRVLIEVLAMEAMLYDAQGDQQAAFKALRHSLSLAQPSGFIRLYVDLGPAMVDLLSRMPAQGESSDYIQRILAASHTSESIAAHPGGDGSNGHRQLVEPLTEREQQVLELLAQRFSNKEIAGNLVISPVTVKRHTINIYQKLGVNSRKEAVAVAGSLGILRGL